MADIDVDIDILILCQQRNDIKYGAEGREKEERKKEKADHRVKRKDFAAS